jgi:septum formation protein
LFGAAGGSFTEFLMYRSRPLLLASASPRRRELLESAGISFEVIPSGVDEVEVPGESPEAMVRRLAETKAGGVAARYPSRWVLGADTTVAFEGRSFGKPTDREDAHRMLRQLQGRRHSVWSAFALLCAEEGVCHVEASETVVELAPLDEGEIQSYVATGEPLDKAGGYAVQGIAQCFVRAIDGSYTTVVGLDLLGVVSALKRFGIIEGTAR